MTDFEYLDLEVTRKDQKTFVSCKSNTDGWSLRYDLGETEELSQTSSPSAESTFQTRRLLSALKFMSALAPGDTCANLMDQGGLVLFAEVASERDPREATASCVCLVDNVYL
ncbi:MAG: hypothetical protein KVP17_004918 [Porospora cf. gigantea B]|uniref:uncharacterized protein n=1 Tax=Porospora cf. gigantea B TaxID=2853592 RepID=UPI00357195B9|nr:MAG: hypothetical protein KVP17_004918 [Porospora cf. gigantea B]